ncbi:MAG: dimethylmenaquinone methyltransferase [Bryobacterales bacterium]|jgi:4-hydroxy-4-methyl-2-oxoglutarate aldolase|nr:dimethylmenaquinone methyltransferase [Bryobacterales bacterium]
MTRAIVLLVCGLCSLALQAQMRLSREQMIHYTPLNKFERFPDGRPKVPEALLDRVRTMSVEEAWGVMRQHGYVNQYAGDFQILKPGQKLVGRALTAQYLPFRPDLASVLDADAKAAGFTTRTTNKTIDILELHDVPVIDLIGAAPGNNYGGDNLHAAIWGRARTGAVVEGTIRDLEGIADLPHQVYFRLAHPAAVANVLVLTINQPVRIGQATVMPGDVVLGDRTGVVFIPPHLVEEIVEKAELTQIKDEWTKDKLMTGKYKSSEVYGGPLSPELQKEYDAYVKRRLAEKRKQ